LEKPESKQQSFYPVQYLPFQRPNLNEIQTKLLRVFLLAPCSTALPEISISSKLTQPLIVSTVQLTYTIKEKGGKPDRKPYPLPYGLRNPYRNLKSENSQDYAQKPQRNCEIVCS
jgi:hypothetical protein